jgi:hypothetical protein
MEKLTPQQISLWRPTALLIAANIVGLAISLFSLVIVFKLDTTTLWDVRQVPSDLPNIGFDEYPKYATAIFFLEFLPALFAIIVATFTVKVLVPYEAVFIHHCVEYLAHAAVVGILINTLVMMYSLFNAADVEHIQLLLYLNYYISMLTYVMLGLLVLLFGIALYHYRIVPTRLALFVMMGALFTIIIAIVQVNPDWELWQYNLPVFGMEVPAIALWVHIYGKT